MRLHREIAHYFEYSDVGCEVLEDGLKVMPFGEYLIERRALNRQQLFLALSEMDRNPGVRLGEVVAALGYLTYREVDGFLAEFHSAPLVEVA
jgi:hypothetical protein